ncbi:MAG: hypothetical protein J5I59_07470 [Saprospiraceae bacterium]|nr:hypothetical protein [Saprospiraceae bacterium]
MSKNILVCPLNWGLGHASRCVTVINALLQRGHSVYLASDGNALELLKNEFPDLPFLNLPGYKITYSRRNLLWAVMFRLPSMIKAIVKEKKIVADYVRLHHIDYIISDNRFGCLSRLSENIFITHQLYIPLKNKIFNFFANVINRWMIRRFDRVWVPDEAPPNHICGKMSAPTAFPHTSYLGILSRLKAVEMRHRQTIIAILSGPEPQRSQLEEILLNQAAISPHTMLLVRGLPEASLTPPTPPHIQCVNFMNTDQLNKAIGESKVIIARSGYTTIMDLLAIGRKGILIPTPGQPEQEYLGERLKQSNQFIVCHQDKFWLDECVNILLNQKINLPAVGNSSLVTTLDKAGL